MPLTREGRKVKREMQETYGKKKGEQVFYATMHKKGKKWHHSPETFDDTSYLPRKLGGPTYTQDQPQGSKAAQPDGVTEYGTFHGDTPHKNVSVNESDPYPGKAGIKGGQPEGVDGPFDDKP
jgi:hypothetical protein